MKPTSLHSFKRLAYSVALTGSALLFVPMLSAKPIPDNLGYGLDTLVESAIALRSSEQARSFATLHDGYATEAAAANARAAITSEDGRVMVDITLNGAVPFAELKDSLAANFGSFEVSAVDAKYKGVGIIEGYVSLDEAAELAKSAGVRGVFLSRKPYLAGSRPAGPADTARKNDTPSAVGPTLNALNQVGSKFDQGVTQHRVDKVCRIYDPSATLNYDGSGITVGVLSDSFNTRGTGSTAASAMASFDLPGAPGNPVNTQPVVVLQDDPASTDEGRGMAEIVYKMAPKAKIGFATADLGEVNFANNIRALSGRFAVPHTQADFRADVITDDVGYGGEPVFTDTGVIAMAVDDVAALGVSYFSSAGNSYGVTVYNSDLRMLPKGNGLTASSGNASLAGTNIDLTNVPTNLYQGGFHNFNPNGGQDIACLWNVSNGASLEMQWDDPYDTAEPTLNQPPLYSNSGTVTSATPVTFSDVPPLSAGQKYVIKETATSGNFDGIVSIIDSNNVTIVDQDTGTDEVVTFFPPVSGQYRIAVRRFGTTSGSFTLTVNTASGGPLLTTDLNMLAFRVDTGAYVPGASLTSNNYANNRPVELGTVVRPTGQTQLQFVIARSSAPIGPQQASTHVRLGTDANSDPNSAPAEYFDYNSTVTGGHNTAAGCNGTAAYDVFRPNIQQNFTSAGPALIYFDRNDNRIAGGPIVRLQPTVAAANNANTTWLNSDSANDFDTGGGQFGGTSASAPHAAGIAALVMQAHGGPGMVSPSQMTSILERSSFPHDLDPYFAIGVARATNGAKITVSVTSDQTAVQSRGRNDPNSHTIALIGPSSITSFAFNPNGLATEGGAVNSGRNGLDTANNYFSIVTPGMYFSNSTATGTGAVTGAFPFTFGNSTGVAPSDVSFALSNQAPSPAVATPSQGQTLTLTIAPGALTGGDILRFTIGRGITRGPNVANAAGVSIGNYNADNFGGGVLIPEGTIIPDGMRFRGTLADGATFDGVMRNRIGFGYSNLDGYGFINAERAVTTPIQ